MSPATLSSGRIRQLNDAVRAAGPAGPGHWVMTAGVNGRGVGFAALAIQEVMGFTAFTSDNDPYAEHDFGSFNLAGELLFWKIDYYDRQLEGASLDPGDPRATQRVITIMLADEY